MRLLSCPRLAVLACGLCTASHASVIVSASPAIQDSALGQIVKIDIDISGVADLYAWQFDLGFDPTRLAAVSIAEGDLLSTGGNTIFVPGLVDNVFGTISSTAGTLSTAISGVSGSGTLATAEFEVLAKGSSTVNIFNLILLDSTLSSIPADTGRGNGDVPSSDGS